MSERNLEAVRALYERWEQGDFTTAPDLFDEHVLLILGPGFPDAGRHVGPEGIARYMRGFLEPWDRIVIEALNFTEAGESVVVEVLQRGTGTGSGAPTELRYFQVWTFRGARVIRLDSIRERRTALEAVGV